jgi:hypothetical protein
VEGDAQLQEPVEKNEFGYPVFSHTSPIYVPLGGREVFDSATAQGLLDEMKSDLHEIEEHAKFADDGERRSVMEVYEKAMERLSKRLAEHKSQAAPTGQPPSGSAK